MFVFVTLERYFLMKIVEKVQFIQLCKKLCFYSDVICQGMIFLLIELTGNNIHFFKTYLSFSKMGNEKEVQFWKSCGEALNIIEIGKTYHLEGFVSTVIVQIQAQSYLLCLKLHHRLISSPSPPSPLQIQGSCALRVYCLRFSEYFRHSLQLPWRNQEGNFQP